MQKITLGRKKQKVKVWSKFYNTKCHQDYPSKSINKKQIINTQVYKISGSNVWDTLYYRRTGIILKWNLGALLVYGLHSTDSEWGAMEDCVKNILTFGFPKRFGISR